MQPVSVSVLERHVFSKPYFDRHGLVLAVDGDEVLGFAHAGFGPNSAFSGLSTDMGAICLVLVQNHADEHEIRRQVFLRAEEYLVARGAKELRAGGFDGKPPFYLGLYGGSALTGILKSDVHNIEIFRELGYVDREETRLLRIAIDDFHQVTDRDLIQNRRKFQVESDFEVRSKNWWEACQYAQIDRFRFRLRARADEPVTGEVTFWDMGPINPRAGMSAMGLTDLIIKESSRTKGLGRFLVSEAMRQVQATEIGVVLVQVPRSNVPANRLFEHLGFVETDVSVSFGKVPTP
jgi:ribosomal protein S18 acetylase RimI-like enzyme